jgi:transcriptional regulator with XRE-family HTH domain
MPEIADEELREFGAKLRALRTANGLTLLELANELGYASHGYLSEIESGRKMPTALFVLRVARLFAITTDELLKDELRLLGMDARV